MGHPRTAARSEQIQTGLAVAADGGIPVFHHAYEAGRSGGAGHRGDTALKQIAGPRSFLLVGDSKLISYANAAAMAAAQVSFVAPLPPRGSRLGCSPHCRPGRAPRWITPPRRDAGKPAAARGTYRVLETGMDIPGPRRTPSVHLPDPGVLLGTPPARPSQALKLAKPPPNCTSRCSPPVPASTPPKMPCRPRPGDRLQRRAEVPRTAITAARLANPSWPGTSTRILSTLSRRGRLVRAADQPVPAWPVRPSLPPLQRPACR